MKRDRFVLLATLLLLPVLFGFSPFSRVNNVCPKCPMAKTDVVVLQNGYRVWGNVVAQNDSYYVIERYGEYRAVTKKESTSIEWKDRGGPAHLGTGDQILLKNNVVLHGAIIEEKTGRYFVIQVGSLRHVAWVDQIRSVHKGGRAYSIKR